MHSDQHFVLPRCSPGESTGAFTEATEQAVALSPATAGLTPGLSTPASPVTPP
jgi:hypothetical protein